MNLQTLPYPMPGFHQFVDVPFCGSSAEGTWPLEAATWYPSEEVAFVEVRALGRVFDLKNRVPVTIWCEGGDAWWCESKELRILAFGHSRSAALASFREDFAVLWEAIAQSADETLTSDAIQAKRAFHRIVRSVEVE